MHKFTFSLIHSEKIFLMSVTNKNYQQLKFLTNILLMVKLILIFGRSNIKIYNQILVIQKVKTYHKKLVFSHNVVRNC